MKNKVALAAILLLTSLSAGSLMAQPAMERIKTSYPVVMQEYGKQMSDLKTDYIIAIDVSATMGRHKNEVIPALTQFFDNIGDGNYVRIISFGTLAKEEQTRLEISKQTRPQIVAKLNYVYDQVMNDPGMRNNTDFVLLGNKVLDLVENDDVSDIHFIVVFSDIMDDPRFKAAGSRHRAQKDWDDLKHRFGALETPINTISTYFSHETKDEKQILESIELVQKSFPNFEYSSDINEVLGEKLENSKVVIYTNKLRQLISKDVNDAGKLELFASSIKKDKRLSLGFDMNNDATKVKKYITGFVVDSCIVNEKTIDILDVDFENHKNVDKRVGSSNIGTIGFDKTGLWTKDCSVDYTMQYHFLYQQGKDEKAQSFTKDMEALGLLDQLPQKSDIHAEGKFVFIWSFWLIILLALALLTFLIFLIKNTIIPGRIVNKQLFCKDLVGVNYSFNASGKRKFLVGNPQACGQADWKLPNTGFVVRVKAKNGGPFNWIIKKKILFQLEEKQNVTMLQAGKQIAKADILRGIIEVNDGFGKSYHFSIGDLVKKSRGQ